MSLLEMALAGMVFIYLFLWYSHFSIFFVPLNFAISVGFYQTMVMTVDTEDEYR